MAQIKNNSGVSKKIGWSFAEKIFPQLAGLVISIILARILSPSAYQIVAIILIFVGISDAFVTSGFGVCLIQKDKVDELDYSTMTGFSIVAGMAVAFILIGLSWTIERYFRIAELGLLIRVMSIKIPLDSFTSVQRAYLQRQLEFGKILIPSCIGTVVSGSIGIVMAYSGCDVWSLVLQQLSYAVVLTIALFFVSTYRFSVKFSFERFKPLYCFGWKIIAISFISKIYDELRSIIIGREYADNSLSYYKRGIQIPITIVSVINSSVTSVMFPVMARMQNNLLELRHTLRKALQLSTYMVAPMMIGLFVIAKPFVIIVFTEKWIDAVPYMRIFSITYIFLTAQELNQQVVCALGRSDLSLKTEVIKKIAGIISIVIALFCFNTPIAIALSFTVYSTAALMINMYFTEKLIGYGFLRQIKDVSASILLAIAMGGVIYPFSFLIANQTLLILSQVTIGFLFYVIASEIIGLEEYKLFKRTIMQLIRKSNPFIR